MIKLKKKGEANEEVDIYGNQDSCSKSSGKYYNLCYGQGKNRSLFRNSQTVAEAGRTARRAGGICGNKRRAGDAYADDGGEFCGNATRSFGYLLSMLSKDKPKEVMVDVSGSEKVLKAEVDLEEGTSRVEMPVPLEIKEIHLGEEGVYPVVVFEGICHMIVESEPRDQEFVNRLMKKAEQICPCDAYGVMFLQGKNMVPVVYVKETDSMVWESSCGSGSMGAAVYLSQAKENGWYICELHQPGGVIEVSVCREQGKVTACKMGGPVTISEEMKVEVNI